MQSGIPKDLMDEVKKSLNDPSPGKRIKREGPSSDEFDDKNESVPYGPTGTILNPCSTCRKYHQYYSTTCEYKAKYGDRDIYKTDK